MATGISNTCVICGKRKATLKCGGCQQDFCYNHVTNHRQELNQELDEIEVSRDVFRQTLTDHVADLKTHVLIKQIDKWERESINKVRQAAEEAKQTILQHTMEHTARIEIKLNKLTNELRESRLENDFFETDLKQWKEELKWLTEELARPPNIKLQQDHVSIVNQIYVNVIYNDKMVCSNTIGTNTKWIQNGITVAGGNDSGNKLNQLYRSHGICIDDDQNIYIADYRNNRILVWKSSASCGQIVAGGNGEGHRTDQLNGPTDVVVDKRNDCLIICDRDNRRVVQWSRRNCTHGEIIIPDIDCYGLAIDNDGYFYVSDTMKNEVRRWKIGDTYGMKVAGGNGDGNHLDQLFYPTHLFVDDKYSVYVSDRSNHRVIKWKKGAKEGIVVAGGQGKGNSLENLSNPRGVIVDQLDNVYVADDCNHRVICWPKGATKGTVVVGGNGKGAHANQLDGPTGLSFDRKGNLYVVDWGNHRVQRFNIDSSSNLRDLE